MKFRFKKNENNNIIMDGLELNPSYYPNSGNRIMTLLFKGLIVYLVAAGLIGGALSATKSSFNDIIFNIFIIFIAVIICFIYFNKKTENIGDILYVILLVIVGLRFRNYINTGFYSWMNDIIGAASVYFDLSDVGGYATSLSNSSTSMTIAACYLGAIVAIIVILSIVKKMHYLDLVLDVILILFLPSYLELEPNRYYSTILICGIIMSIIWSLSGRFEKIDNTSVYSIKKNFIFYNYSPKALMGVFLQSTLVVLVTLTCIFSVLSNDNYSIIRTKSDMKRKSDEVVEIFITSGFGGFFNRYENVGGISSGRLGGVSSIRLDYKTNLEVTFAPYNFSPVYLRTFVGADYVPYENRWMAADNSMVNNREYEYLFQSYNENKDFTAQSKFVVNNVEGEYGEYYGYYSDRRHSLRRGESAESYIYPRFDGTSMSLEAISISEDERRYYLTVPNDNRPSIIKITEQMGLSSDMDEMDIANIIKDYYLENIPYTLRPGSTPWNKDFINYFLDRNKKGYCVHFASAATLMFRQLGIPARYVEGYAFDYNDIIAGEVVEGVDVSQYYDGYSEIKKLGVIKVNVLDANAHAWVEIFTDEYGWIPVELTPPSSDTEDNRESIFDRFLRMFTVDRTDEAVNQNEGLGEFDSSKLFILLYVFIILFIVLPVLYFCIRFLVYIYIYAKADINTKLIYRYRIFIKRNRHRYNDESRLLNYRSSMEYICGDKVDDGILNSAIRILEKAGFSNTSITQSEFDETINILKKKYK